MRTNQPLVSVVMCTYNGEKFLAEQIESILNQTYVNIELIITDDCSTDGTQEIINAYASRLSNVSASFNESNLGYIRNFEKGMLLARGEFIALSDQDDIWLPHKIEKLVNNIGTYDIVYCDSALIDDDGNGLQKKMSDVINQVNYTDCLMFSAGAWIPGHAQLIRRGLLENCIPFPEVVAHDFWLGFVASHKNGAAYFDEALVLYRQHASSLVGANTLRKGKNVRKKTAAEKAISLRERMHLLYTHCPAHLPQKKIYADLNRSYQNFSLENNWLRAKTFFKHRHKILAYKKKNRFSKMLFCVKMFFKLY